jgi:hypothetical protein
VVQGKAKVGAVIGGFVHGSVKLRATRHDSGSRKVILRQNPPAQLVQQAI